MALMRLLSKLQKTCSEQNLKQAINDNYVINKILFNVCMCIYYKKLYLYMSQTIKKHIMYNYVYTCNHVNIYLIK